MPFWVQMLLTQLVNYVSGLVTPELIAKYEKLACEFVVARLRELAKSTTTTDLDDKIVEIVARALGVK